MLIVLLSCVLSACSDEGNWYLTRIDIQKITDEEIEMYEEEFIVVDLVTLDSIKSLFDEVKWKPNSLKKMSTSEDLLLTLFFTYEKKKAEKLFLYQIWFGDDEVIIMSNNEEEGYGKLEGDNAIKLKNILLGQVLEEELQ